jgi:hypothetical protein
MEHCGVEYEVVQTITNTWRWSVKRAGSDKVGIALDRTGAIMRAKRFIDGLSKLRPKPEE